MDASLKREVLKDVFGLSAVFIFLCTMLLASFRWSDTPGPAGALALLPLVLFVAAYIVKRYRFYTSARGRA